MRDSITGKRFNSETESEFNDALPMVSSPHSDKVTQESKGVVEMFFGWFRAPQSIRGNRAPTVTVSDEDGQTVELSKFDYPSDIPQN